LLEVNLVPGKRKTARRAANFGGGLLRLRAVFSNITNPWLLGAVAAWVLVLAGGLALFVATKAQRAVLDSRLETARVEKRRFDSVIGQKRQSEKIRDSLVAEIGMIRTIDESRYIWPHILDQLAKALPPYTWLMSVTNVPTGTPAPPALAGAHGPADTTSAPSVRFTLTGSTVDMQAYTTFLRQLAASPWFTNVVPASSQVVTEQDRPVIAFTISAQYRVADSVYIHRVPLASLPGH
jgi:Tfp pilus assembly protein PilN